MHKATKHALNYKIQEDLKCCENCEYRTDYPANGGADRPYCDLLDEDDAEVWYTDGCDRFKKDRFI